MAEVVVAGGKEEPRRRLVAVREVRRGMARDTRMGCKARHQGPVVHQLGSSLNRQDCQFARNEVAHQRGAHRRAEGKNIAEWLQPEVMAPRTNC